MQIFTNNNSNKSDNNNNNSNNDIIDNTNTGSSDSTSNNNSISLLHTRPNVALVIISDGVRHLRRQINIKRESYSATTLMQPHSSTNCSSYRL